MSKKNPKRTHVKIKLASLRLLFTFSAPLFSDHIRAEIYVQYEIGHVNICKEKKFRARIEAQEMLFEGEFSPFHYSNTVLLSFMAMKPGGGSR